AEVLFKWRSHCLTTRCMNDVHVEICGFRICKEPYAIAPIAVKVRRSINSLDAAANPEVDRLTYWIAHNLRGPLATLEGLINLAKTQKSSNELSTYLNYMTLQAERLEEKIQMMVRLAG